MPSFIVGSVEDVQLLFEDSAENSMTCSTLGRKPVRLDRAVEGIVLLYSKPVQLAFDYRFLLMKSAVELQLLLGILAEFPWKEITFGDNQLRWTVIDANWILFAALHSLVMVPKLPRTHGRNVAAETRGPLLSLYASP